MRCYHLHVSYAVCFLSQCDCHCYRPLGRTTVSLMLLGSFVLSKQIVTQLLRDAEGAMIDDNFQVPVARRAQEKML